MPWTLDERFRVPENDDVLGFIAQHPDLSAHDEVADCLNHSADGLSGVGWYCPNPQHYAYVVLHTRDHVIFALAFGQGSVAYRLPPEGVPAAGEAGVRGYPDIGPGWILVDPWRPQAGVVLRHWCEVAYEHAMRLGVS